MALIQYTVEVKDGLLLELPSEAEELHLRPGDKLQIQLNRELDPVEQNDEEIRSSIAPEKRVSALGKYAGLLSSEEFLRRKHEETILEDRPISERLRS
jgi:hypothetical protein